MGADIHCWAERKFDRGDWQVCANWEPFSTRNYFVFGWLAGVRNYSGVGPIIQPRGFPDDASEPVKRDFAFWTPGSHTPGWLSLEELLAVDYEQIVEDRRFNDRGNYGATCKPGDGKLMTLRKLLGEDYFEQIELLKEVDAGRIIFWFDN